VIGFLGQRGRFSWQLLKTTAAQIKCSSKLDYGTTADSLVTLTDLRIIHSHPVAMPLQLNQNQTY
jgi:hypothetical protein